MKKINNNENQDEVWDLVELIDELNYKKLELMDEGSAKAKVWSKVEPHVRSNACADFKQVVESIADVPDIEADLVTKARIKEVVMEYASSVNIAGRIFFARKSFWAAATLLAVLFFNFYPMMPFFPYAAAEKVTYVEVEQGSVTVERGDKSFEVFDYMVLKSGDRVTVNDGSLAEIYFMDDSRVALAPEASVDIWRLYVDDENEAWTEVEIFVEEGTVWAQVINLTSSDDYLSVLTDQGEFRVNRSADLNVTATDGQTFVQVVKNLASFYVDTECCSREGLLGEGSQLLTYADELLIEEIFDMEGDVWWDYNLVKGQEHIASVTQYYITETADKLDLLSQDPLRTIKKFQDTVSEAVGIQSSLVIEDAEETLAEAEQLLSDGDEDEAEVKIQEYLSIVEDLVVDEEGTNEVKAQVDQATKELSVKVSENKNLTVIQDALDVVDESVSTSSVTKADNASNKLSTVSSLIDAGSYADALEQLDSYTEGALETAFDVSDIPSDERAQAVGEILDKKIEDLHLLKIISSKLGDLEDVVDPELSEQISETKQQTLVEINALVVSLKERAIGAISGFILDVQADESVQIQVLSSLKEDVALDLDVMKKINDIEEVYYDEGSLVFLVSDEE